MKKILFAFPAFTRHLGILLALLMLSLPQYVFSQSPQSWTSADMYQGLQKLKVLGAVLYVAAHPDDENTRLIAYLSKDKLYRTGYLSMTRGDGGQNLIGNEQGIELGLIRTQELLAARRIDGGEQFFTRAFDFGFSKNPDETFTKWDKEKILGDVVWVIRKFQPDVIITRFPTTGEGGHGHHTASAILANEAFTAAADPTRFPEQLKFVKPWQAKRVVLNGFNVGGGGGNSPQNDKRLRLDVGGYNPLLGKSYGEIAAESRSQHKSQGFGVAAGRGEALEFFATTGGTAPKNDLMDEVDITWNKIKGGDAIVKMIDGLVASFDLAKPEKSVEGLVNLYKAMNQLEDGYWKTQKLKEVKELIAQCSGLFMDATTNTQFAVQTDSVRIIFSLNNRLGVEAALEKITIDKFDSSFSQPLGKNRNINIARTFFVPADKPVTQPYWLEHKMETGYYNVSNPVQVGQPDVDPAYLALIQIKIAGESIVFTRPVKYKHTDPVKGEIYQPLVITPPVLVKTSPEFMLGTKEIINKYNVSIKAMKDVVFTDEKIHLTTPDINEDLKPGVIQSLSRGKEASFEYTGLGYPFLSDMKISLKGRQSAYDKDILHIAYDHIPDIYYYRPSAIILTSTRMAVYGKKIGYIIGAGDKVPEALEQMGYDVSLLTDKELSRNNLVQFDAIITGVRAYNTNEWMNNYYDKLMKYVNDGGNLIVQYNTSSNIGPVRAKMGPYNFNISRTRVTDENATISLLKPQHPVLNFPNKITQDDFSGWIQERSIYHASAWDTTKFETILSMNDPGERADQGSLIIAKYGKGYFTYTGLVFFRELPAGVPGAYRLLANIIALNRKKGF
jgi:LmbE family N-acetylglucosaminyl deacetylase